MPADFSVIVFPVHTDLSSRLFDPGFQRFQATEGLLFDHNRFPNERVDIG